MDNKHIFQKLKAFFSGRISESARDLFGSWFDSFDDSRGFVDGLSDQEKRQHKQRLFKKIKSDLNIDDRSKNKRPSSVGGIFWKLAAIIVLGFMLSLAGLYIYNTSQYGDNEIAFINKTTGAGEIATIELSDGSKVWLSAESSLQYPQKFTSQERVLRLQGEAFFEVASDSSRPFIVHAQDVQTRVLGTSFNIEAYPHGTQTNVTLATGKIEVAAKHDTAKMVLTPDEQVIYDHDKGFGPIKKVDAALEHAWMKGELIFMRESFARIATTFERWYGKEFVFEDKALKEEVFVYHFTEMSLEKSMQILSELADFKYEISNEQVIIYSE